MIIRKAALGDVESCFHLSRQEKEHYWTRQDFKDSVRDKDVVFLVAEEKERVIGYSSGFIVPTKRTEALMHETRVDVNYRGKRIGTKLVDTVSKALFSRRVKIIYAMIEPKLKPFYINSCKFKETGKWLEASKKRR